MITNLGERIKMFRELRGFSQGELAKRADISRPTISFIESGVQRSVSLDRAQKIATAFGISLDMLTGYKQEREQVWRISIHA
jgi:transcriptional regulator with XRE-family HTH domain